MSRVSLTLFWFALTIAISGALYATSYRVQELSEQLVSINDRIETELTNIHVLKAEWVYLANPARIERAARKHLAMHPTAVKQIARLDRLPEILPTRKEAMAGVTVESTPIASVKTSLAAPPPTAALPQHAEALAGSAHINTHMIIQRTANAAPLPRGDDEMPSTLDPSPHAGTSP